MAPEPNRPEPAPEPAATVAKVEARKRRTVRFYVFSAFVCAVVLFLVTISVLIFTLVYQPKILAMQVLQRAFAPLPVQAETIHWSSPFELEFTGLKVGEIGTIEAVRIRVTPSRLISSDGFEIESIELDKPNLTISWRDTLQQQRRNALSAQKEFQRGSSHTGAPVNSAFNHNEDDDKVPLLSVSRKEAAKGTDTPAQPINPLDVLRPSVQAPTAATPRVASLPLRLKNFTLKSGTLSLNDLGPGIPPIVVPLNNVATNLWLGNTSQVQVAIIPDFALYSPYDANAKVLEFETLEIHYTLGGLLTKRLEKLLLLHPKMYIGEQLFWFSDFVKKRVAELPKSSGPAQPWSIGDFAVRGGTVILATHGQPDLELPIIFSASQQNLVLGELQDLHLKSDLTVPKVTIDRPEYKLHVADLEGKLEFALPRTNINANNIFSGLSATAVRFDKFSATNLWLGVTFDQFGIYGRFGGASYSGYINGDVTVLFKDEFEWVGSISVSDVNLAPVTRTFTPDNVIVEGRGTGAIVAKGRGKLFRKVDGNFKLATNGVLRIKAVDDLITKAQGELSGMKLESVRLVLNALKEYHYSLGEAHFNYEPPTSKLLVNLEGAEGKRTLDLTYHHLPSKTGTTNNASIRTAAAPSKPSAPSKTTATATPSKAPQQKKSEASTLSPPLKNIRSHR